MGKIYITRHGETEWNVAARLQGQCDSPLTPLGIRQATWLGERLKDISIDAIYTSPLGRAAHTAKIVAINSSLDERIIKHIDELMEIYLGSWQGMHIDEVSEIYPEQIQHFWHKPERYQTIDGESFEVLMDRAYTKLMDLAKTHEHETILLVSHTITIKALLNVLLNKGDIKSFWDSPDLTQTSLTILNYQNAKFNIEVIADTSHHQEISEQGGGLFTPRKVATHSTRKKRS